MIYAVFLLGIFLPTITIKVEYSVQAWTYGMDNGTKTRQGMP